MKTRVNIFHLCLFKNIFFTNCFTYNFLTWSFTSAYVFIDRPINVNGFTVVIYVVAMGAAMFNLFPNKPWFLRVCSTSLLKTMWEKEKLLVTSNFSLSHSVFCLFGELSASFIKFINLSNCRLQL